MGFVLLTLIYSVIYWNIHRIVQMDLLQKKKIMFDQGYEIMKMIDYLFVMMKFQNNDVKDQLNKLRVYNKLSKAVEQ